MAEVLRFEHLSCHKLVFWTDTFDRWRRTVLWFDMHLVGAPVPELMQLPTVLIMGFQQYG